MTKRRATLLACVALLVASGCGEPAPGSAAGTDVATDVGALDAGVAEDSGPEDTGGGIDAGPVCPGGAGCPCDEASDCDNNLCIQTPAGKVCAQTCVETCPEGFDCETVAGAGSDTVQLCVPRWGFLCAPCDTDAACQEALGDHNSYCMRYGAAEGSYCGASCAEGADCPEGYSCEERATVKGELRKACVRSAGLCPCSPRSASAKLSTTCQAKTDLGTCPGTRTCTAEGAIDDCSAPPAVDEVCDGVDNDCNGKTDDGLCDDKNPCTVDACVKGGTQCVHTPTAGTCDDDDACTAKDACDDKGGCSGEALTCDDDNPCTTDSCDKATGCVFTPHNKPCNDANACTHNDLCDGKGACLGLAIEVSVTCDDNNPCTTDTCDPNAKGTGITAGCDHGPKAGPCEDDNPCTNGDACKGGTCNPGPNVCACTQDGDCKSKEDNDLCNGVLFCDKAKAPYVCKVDPTSVVSCDKTGDTACAKVQCKPQTGKCEAVAEADGKACDADGSVCTSGDACKAGVCAKGAAVDCDDKNPCTDDSCDPAKGCKSANNIAACDADGSACTVGDVCKNGACTKGPSKSCDDKESCTVDSCDPKTGACKNDGAAMQGKACDADGSKCTVGDTCNKGACQAGTTLDCDDGKACTKDSCNPASGCEHAPLDGAKCDDGDPCTAPDSCKGGACSGKKLACSDGNPCTQDGCGPKGCTFTTLPDGSSCGGGKHCVAKACVTPSCGDGYVGKGELCDDGNAAMCDGCEACQPRGNLALANKAWAVAQSPSPGPDGTVGPLSLTGDLTIEAWVRPEVLAAEQVIVARSSKSLGVTTFSLSLSGGQPVFMHKSPFGVEFFGAKAGGKAKLLPAKQWSHVAVVVSGDALRFFVGGSPAGGGTLFKPRFDVPTAGVTLGRAHSDAAGGELTGQLDEVHIARAPLYGGAFVPGRSARADRTTVALWRFDGGIDDAGPHGLKLKLEGAKTAPDSCLGRSPKSAVCGDGKVEPGLESCDDGNASACDGCEGCRAESSFDVAGKGALQTEGFPQWAADSVCPTCTATLEAWVRVDQTSGTYEILGASCGIFSLMVSQTTNGTHFGLVRFPLPPLFGTTTVKAGVWYHVAAVVGFAKGGPMRLYVNGKLEGSATAVMPAALPGWQIDKEVLFIGGGAKGTGQGCVFKGETPVASNRLPGRIDEARLSHGARYGGPFTPRRRLLPDNTTRGLWHFDGPKGLTGDDSGQGKDGGGVVTKLLAGTASADVCYGEIKGAAACGDGQTALWEGCDNGAANGAWPSKCDVLCRSNSQPDCSSVSWSAGSGNQGKNTGVYSNTKGEATPWTLEGWVRFAKAPSSGYGALVSVDEAATSGGGCKSQGLSQAWRVAVGSGGLDQSRLGGSTQKASASKLVWRPGTWQHFALQFHGDTTGSLWVDGALARTFTDVKAGWSASCPIRLGDHHDGKATHPFAAELAGLRWSQSMRYGERFDPTWQLDPDALATWAFALGEGKGTVATDQKKGFKLDLPKATWSTKAGPGCTAK